jgi:hypothetical protein
MAGRHYQATEAILASVKLDRLALRKRRVSYRIFATAA